MTSEVHSRKSSRQLLSVRSLPELRAQAESLLEALCALDDGDPALDHGATLWFGWSLVTLRGGTEGAGLVAHEPDFANDPLTMTRDDLSCTLHYVAEQQQVLGYIGVRGEPVRHDQRLTISPDCLFQELIHLQRREPAFADDSGWHVGFEPGSRVSRDRVETMRVHELLGKRPGLLKVLVLPRGYVTVLRGDSVESIVDDFSQDVWSGRRSGPPR